MRYFIILLTFLGVLSGCGPVRSQPEAPPEDETPARAPLEEPAEPLPVPQDCAKLEDAALAWFQNEFFGGAPDTYDWDRDVRNPRPQFLTSLYDEPAEIDLAELLYMGGPEAGVIGDAERQDLLDLGFPTAVPWQKYTTAAIDAFLLEHLGLTLAETRGMGLEELRYLPAYDAYYSCRSDANSGPVTLDGGWTAPDGTVTLVYHGSIQVTLAPQDDGSYRFVSNLLPLTAAELDWFQNDFFTSAGAANAFLTCAYETPENIDLAELLYNGLSNEDPRMGPERAALESLGYPLEMDWQKSTVEQINSLLETYAGLSLGEMSGLGLNRLTYLPAYRAYYSSHGDCNSILPDLSSGRFSAGGQVRLVYVRYGDELWETALVRRDALSRTISQGGWRFVYNRPLA